MGLFSYSKESIQNEIDGKLKWIETEKKKIEYLKRDIDAERIRIKNNPKNANLKAYAKQVIETRKKDIECIKAIIAHEKEQIASLRERKKNA